MNSAHKFSLEEQRNAFNAIFFRLHIVKPYIGHLRPVTDCVFPSPYHYINFLPYI